MLALLIVNYALCFIFALAAALLQQVVHWNKILRIPDSRKRKRYSEPPFLLLSACTVVCSGILGIIAAFLFPPAHAGWGFVLAALIGFSPWATLKSIFKKSVPLGGNQNLADPGGEKLTFRDFLNP